MAKSREDLCAGLDE